MEIPAHIIIIGLHSERPRSGKSTVAAALAAAQGGKVYSIVSGVRDLARQVGLQVAADAVGDEKDKPHPDLYGATPREVLIRIGEQKADEHGRTFWLNRLLSKIFNDASGTSRFVAIIDDVRRAEEGQGLVDLGATMVTITRQGTVDVPDINGWRSGESYTFANETTPEDCAERIWGRVRQGGVISAVAVGHRQAALAVMCRG